MVFAVFVAVQIGFCDWPFIEATFLVVVVVVDVVVVVVAVVVLCCCCDPNICYWSHYISLWSKNVNLRLLKAVDFIVVILNIVVVAMFVVNTSHHNI